MISFEILKFPWRPSRAYSSSKSFVCQGGCYPWHGAPFNAPSDGHACNKEEGFIIDWLILWGFTPYRRYFSRIMAELRVYVHDHASRLSECPMENFFFLNCSKERFLGRFKKKWWDQIWTILLIIYLVYYLYIVNKMGRLSFSFCAISK